MMTIDLCSTSDVITFGQNCHHLHSSSAGSISVIESIEYDICTKLLGAKFFSTTLGYPVSISRLDNAFTGILELRASSVVGQQLQQIDKNRRKRKGKKSLKTSQILVSAYSWFSRDVRKN